MADEQVPGEVEEASPLGVAETGTEGSVESPAAEADKGKDRVAELEQQVAAIKKSYDEIRPFATQKSQEAATLREQLAQMTGKLELLSSQSQRGVSPDVARREQEQFDKDWRDKIAANPEASIDYYRGLAGELQNSMTSKMSETEKSLRAEILAVKELLEERDPFYAANKADVDKLINDAGLDRKTALKVVQAMKGTNGKAAQPGRPGAPGSVQSAGTGETKVRGKPVAIDATTLKVMRGLGLDDKAINKLAVDAGEEGAEQ